MSKKALSFSDFASDDSFNTDDNLDLDQDDKDKDLDDQDDDQDTDVDKGKKVDDKKKQSKTKDVPLDTDDDQDDLKVDDKVKDKKFVKEPLKTDKKVDDDSDDAPDPEEAQKFFEEVEKITGQTVEVDYGDTSPLSPQGVALRDKAIKEQALDTFLEEIEEKFPAAFKALQHAYNGGDITELFNQTTGRDYSKIEIKDQDTPLAKEILTEYYRSKGVKNEAKIAKLIEADEDSELGLVKEAQTALKELKEEQESKTSQIVEKQKQQAAEQKKKDQILVTAVDEVLESRKLGSFRITDRQEASEFKKFVLSSIRRLPDGNYELATPVVSGELERQLQYAYFQYKKGDLSKIIQQKTATENAKKLQLRLQQEQSKTKRTLDSDKQQNQTTLRDFTR